MNPLLAFQIEESLLRSPRFSFCGIYTSSAHQTMTSKEQLFLWSLYLTLYMQAYLPLTLQQPQMWHPIPWPFFQYAAYEARFSMNSHAHQSVAVTYVSSRSFMQGIDWCICNLQQKPNWIRTDPTTPSLSLNLLRRLFSARPYLRLYCSLFQREGSL